MTEHEKVILTRDCEAIIIPDGYKIDLEKGTEATIMQSLGGSYTITTDRGQMVRINPEDVDAIGKEIQKKDLDKTKDMTLEEQVWAELRTVYDPEIPVDIVNLGLIYVCNVVTMPSGKYKVDIRMTLTAPGCGMGDVLKSDVETRVLGIEGIETVDVEMVFDPPWGQDKMSEEAKLKLGLL